MKCMMKATALAGILALTLTACDRKDTDKVTPASRDLGTGLNTVERTYARPVSDMVSLVPPALQALELKVESEKHDNLGGEVIALRATGDKVTVTIRGIEDAKTSVSVRVAPGDRNLANMVQDRIGRDLPVINEKGRQPESR